MSAGPSSTPDGPILLFDGVCNLCNGAVQFIIRRDPCGRFRFAALQSDAAKALLQSAGAGAGGLPDSMVLIEDGRLYTRSSAALRVARHLRFPWPLVRVFWIVPRPLRNWMYDFVARHRYRWFGRRDQCMLPTPELQARFL
jgi:predicted DCC family thiol-disulfide oxidoreductase YuxK